MSQWTHVCGAIRIDSFPVVDDINKGKVKAAFGTTCVFDDSEDVWEMCDVPCGSEGSLQYKIDDNGGEYSITWGIVYIWGDLRHYSNPQAIYEWIKKACSNFMIRSCSVKIDVEYGDKYLVTDVYDGNKTTIELIKIGEHYEK